MSADPRLQCLRSGRASLLRAFERGLLALGLAAFAYCAWVIAEAAAYQAYERSQFERLLRDRAADVMRSPRRAGVPPVKGTVIGRIDIPALGVSTIVREGDDTRTLRLAVGHISGTAWPGDGSNIGLAGHRDQFFRRLRDVRLDDEIQFVTAEATYVYLVDRMHVVEPDDVWVLDPTPHEMLTLVTCFPFSYIGDAPHRFIVRARRTSVQPTPRPGRDS